MSCIYSSEDQGERRKVLTVIALGGESLSCLCSLLTEGLSRISFKVSVVLCYVLSLF